MSSSDQLVSIYLPTRNRVDLLRRAVASVFSQTFKNYELIIVDDHSDDDTRDYCRTLMESDARVRYFRTSVRSGAPYARNLAISEAKGEVITGLDDDDEMLSNRLAELVSSFDVCYSLISSAAYVRTESWQRIRNAGEQVITLEDLLYDNIIGTQVITLKARVTSIGGFDESLSSAQDYDLWVRLVERFGAAKRLGVPTYIMHADNRSDRISVANAQLVGGFLEKHRRLMNPLQVATQELYVIASRGSPLSFSRWMELTNRRTWIQSTRYLITSRFPRLRKLAELLRSLRSRSFRQR